MLLLQIGPVALGRSSLLGRMSAWPSGCPSDWCLLGTCVDDVFTGAPVLFNSSGPGYQFPGQRSVIAGVPGQYSQGRVHMMTVSTGSYTISNAATSHIVEVLNWLVKDLIFYNEASTGRVIAWCHYCHQDDRTTKQCLLNPYPPAQSWRSWMSHLGQGQTSHRQVTAPSAPNHSKSLDPGSVISLR